eukprot:912494-Pelagomonas_calceolata.AAC.1
MDLVWLHLGTGALLKQICLDVSFAKCELRILVLQLQHPRWGGSNARFTQKRQLVKAAKRHPTLSKEKRVPRAETLCILSTKKKKGQWRSGGPGLLAVPDLVDQSWKKFFQERVWC